MNWKNVLTLLLPLIVISLSPLVFIYTKSQDFTIYWILGVVVMFSITIAMFSFLRVIINNRINIDTLSNCFKEINRRDDDKLQVFTEFQEINKENAKSIEMMLKVIKKMNSYTGQIKDNHESVLYSSELSSIVTQGIYYRHKKEIIEFLENHYSSKSHTQDINKSRKVVSIKIKSIFEKDVKMMKKFNTIFGNAGSLYEISTKNKWNNFTNEIYKTMENHSDKIENRLLVVSKIIDSYFSVIEGKLDRKVYNK